MKSDSQIIKYLLPYIKQDGFFLPKKVVIKLYSYQNLKGMLVSFDVKNSFDNNKKNTLTSMLRKNGFKYFSDFDGYYRLMNETGSIVLDGAMIMDNEILIL